MDLSTIISLRELIDIVLMTLFVGYIFSGFIKAPSPSSYDPVAYYKLPRKKRLGFSEDFKFAALVTAPAIILHELGHKFTAIAFGAHAQFHAAYSLLILGAILKAMNFGFIFFVPAYVTHTALIHPWQNALIAFAGPGVNLVLWLGCKYYLKLFSVKNPVYKQAIILSARINMYLFFLNMIPLKLFGFSLDGWQVFEGLYRTFF